MDELSENDELLSEESEILLLYDSEENAELLLELEFDALSELEFEWAESEKLYDLEYELGTLSENDAEKLYESDSENEKLLFSE